MASRKKSHVSYSVERLYDLITGKGLSEFCIRDVLELDAARDIILVEAGIRRLVKRGFLTVVQFFPKRIYRFSDEGNIFIRNKKGLPTSPKLVVKPPAASSLQPETPLLPPEELLPGNDVWRNPRLRHMLEKYAFLAEWAKRNNRGVIAFPWVHHREAQLLGYKDAFLLLKAAERLYKRGLVFDHAWNRTERFSFTFKPEFLEHAQARGLLGDCDRNPLLTQESPSRESAL